MRILPLDVVGASRARTRASRLLLKLLVASCVAATVSACGGGVAIEVAASLPPSPPVVALGIHLTQTAPDQVRVDWSNDPDVHQYVVVRNGTDFANVMTITLFDTSVLVNAQYCYQVSGYDLVGNLIAASDTACIVVAP
jgi:hypothetical protein